MLVLTRKVGEEICIGESIKIKITAIKGKPVKLGLDAPRMLSIRRKELKADLKKRLFNR